MNDITDNFAPDSAQRAEHAAYKRAYRARERAQVDAQRMAEKLIWDRIGVPPPPRGTRLHDTAREPFKNAQYILDSITIVAECVYSLKPAESVHFSSWYLRNVEAGIPAFMAELKYWMNDAIECGDFSIDDLEVGEFYKAFLDNYDRILSIATI